MDGIAGLSHWLDGFALQLEPNQKKELMRMLAQGMRLRFKDRISKQQNPDGNSFIPRKRNQIGNIKRQGAMFQRLKNRLKTEYTTGQAAVGFAGRDTYVASVHQFGRTIRPSAQAKPTRYAIRELVGFGQDDEQWAMSIIMSYLER